MSQDQLEGLTSPNDNKAKTPDHSVSEEGSDNVNLFASVFLKIEVNEEDDEIQFENEKPADRSPRKNRQQKKEKKPCKREKTTIKNQKCTTKTPQTYKCTVCSYESRFKPNLSAHLRKHDVSKQFQCSDCSYSTAYKHNILKHSRTHKKPEECTYNCDKCPFVTKFEGHMTRHLAKLHLEVSDKASRCEHCSFSTKMGWRLNIHRKRSKQEQPVECEHCDYETLYRCALKEHRQSHYGSNKTVNQLSVDTSLIIENVNKEPSVELTMSKIGSCDARRDNNESTDIFHEITSTLNEDPTFYTLNDKNIPRLQNIPQQSEQDSNQYLVDTDCEVTWSNIQVIESPDHDFPFKCLTCDYRAKYKASVRRHYQRHHTSQHRPYKCFNCDFSTKTKDKISLHNKRSKSNEALVCKICAFTSIFKCQFAMHEKEHYPFKCVNCEYKCRKKPDMEKHFAVVHLGNGLKCSYCDYRGPRRESILRHEVIHTGRKPFQCQLCEFASIRRCLLETHLSKVHKTKMAEKIIDYSKIESLKKKTVECRIEKN